MLVEPKTVDEEFLSQMEEYRAPDKSVGLIEACSKNVVVFAEKMLGLRLYAWQVDFLNEIQKICNEPDRVFQRAMIKDFTAITSRQIGKTKCVGIFVLWALVFNKYPGDTVEQRTAIGIVSALDRAAKDFLQAIRMEAILGDRHMEETYRTETGLPMFGSKFFTDLIDDGKGGGMKGKNNTTTLTMKPYKPHLGLLLKGSKIGSIVKSYAPTDSVLGQTFTIRIIDEMGRSDKVTDEFMEYFAPTGNRSDSIKIQLSTPWESSGPFYRLVNPDDIYDDSGTQLFVYSIDAIKLEVPEYWETVQKEIRMLERDGKLDEIKRSYYCRFVKGQTSYFDPEKVIAAFDSSLSPHTEYRGSCDMGIDFGGQVKSKTVITISTMDSENNIIRLYRKAYDVGKDLSLLEDVTLLLKHFNVERIIPDDCPAGFFLINKMKELGWNVQPMNFRADKVKKYGAFRSALNRGKVRSFSDDPCKIEMMAMEYSQAAKQSVLQHAPGYSDDLIDSWIMSAYFYVSEDTGVKTFDYFGGAETESHYMKLRRMNEEQEGFDIDNFYDS